MRSMFPLFCNVPFIFYDFRVLKLQNKGPSTVSKKWKFSFFSRIVVKNLIFFLHLIFSCRCGMPIRFLNEENEPSVAVSENGQNKFNPRAKRDAFLQQNTVNTDSRHILPNPNISKISIIFVNSRIFKNSNKQGYFLGN